MSAARELKEKIKAEVAQKKKSREALLDQLAIVDAELDLLDEIIRPYDINALRFINNINVTVGPVGDAYNERIESGCRSDLIWEEQGAEFSFGPYFGSNGVEIEEQITWKVVKNSATEDSTPFYGIKYYQKPLDRDYGTNIIGNFIGSVETGSSVIAVTQDPSILNSIRVGDTITDSLDTPEIFSLGELPEVIGTGTTSSVGFVTTLTGGITTGSNQFYHYGAGSTSNVTTGMVLSLPGILPDKTLITGFTSGTWPLEYINSAGVLTTTDIISNVLTLNKSALDYIEESQFTVGIITNYPGIFISTSVGVTKSNVEFTALRISRDVDAGFDYLSNPNSPLTIGIINSSNIGAGGSAFLDNSGEPNRISTWDPGKSYRNPITNEIVNPEPEVGGGKVSYNKGTLEWPVITRNSSDEVPITTTTYAQEGDMVRVSTGSSVGIGYVGIPSGGFPPNCGALDAAISSAEAANQAAINNNEDKARDNVNITKALRKERERRQMYAWSLLQGASKLREEIQEGEELIGQLDRIDN